MKIISTIELIVKLAPVLEQVATDITALEKEFKAKGGDMAKIQAVWADIEAIVPNLLKAI